MGNTGMYLLTEDKKSIEGGIGAFVGGGVSAALSSQAGYLAGPITQRGESLLVQYAVSSGGSIAGGAVDNGLAGQGYGGAEMLFDGVAGGVTSHFPGASELGSNPNWMTHSFSAYGGAHVGAIVESVKFVGGEVINQGTGVELW